MNGAHSLLSVTSTWYRVAKAASLSPPMPLPQNRSRPRRTYQLLSSSTKAASLAALSVTR